MQIQYISSACVLVEYNNIRVLCDPWLTEGIYYGSWFHYPLPVLQPIDLQDVDYIYISHIHPDHCDVESLKQFPKTIPILIHEYEEKFLLRLIKAIGFQQIFEVRHKVPFALAPNFSIEIYAADNCDPEKCGQWFGCHGGPSPDKTLQIDSLAVFNGNGKIVVNTNDCPFELSKSVCHYITQKYSAIDFLFVGYSGAGAYPQCMEQYSEEEKLKRAEEKKRNFLKQAISYIQILKPAHFLPFAGQYTLGGRLTDLNPFRGVPELDELPTIFSKLLEEASLNSKLLLLNSGESFDIMDQKPSALFIPPDPNERAKYINNELRNKKFSYELISERPTFESLEERMKKAYAHLSAKQKELGFSSQTTVYIDIGNPSQIFKIPFDGSGLDRVLKTEIAEPFVQISLDSRLLQLILDRKAHWNNAEIGSHLTFFRLPDRYERGIYYFLSFFHVPFHKV
jgi:UDP-MurNAc hydroxylase